MERIVLGNLEVDRERFDARVGERSVELSYTQFELLYQLAAKADKVVEHHELQTSLWGVANVANRQRLRIHVSRLRKKIAGSQPWHIQTVTKRGYALVNREAGARLPPLALVHAPVGEAGPG